MKKSFKSHFSNRQGVSLVSPFLVDSSEAFQAAAKDAIDVLEKELAIPIDLADTEALVRVASTALNSKVVSQYSSLLAPIAVQAVMKVKDNYLGQNNVDLKDIKIVRKLGGTLDDTG